MSSEALKTVLKNVTANVKQKSSSKRDEISVMQAMLNDRKHCVDVYGKTGVEGQYYPGQDFRAMVSDVMSSAAHIDKKEAESLVEGFDFKKTHAETVINVGKEFINTYLETGRKIKLGGRETSDVALCKKEFPAGMRRYPTQIGVDEKGNPINGSSETWVNAYTGVKASSPCPVWVQSKK